MKKAKRKRTAAAPEGISEEYAALMEAHAGEGVSNRRVDYTHVEREGDPWIAAFLELEDGNREPLLALLAGKEQLPDEFRHWVRYIIDKYALVLRRGKGRLVAPYAISNAELRLREADEDVRYLITSKGMRAEQAEATVARRHRLDQDTLHDYRRRARGSTRRMKERKGR